MTSATGSRPAGAAPLPSLPSYAASRDGQRITPADDVWTLRKRADGGGVLHMHWSDMPGVSARMVHLAKLIVASRLPNYATMSSTNDWRSVQRLGRWYRSYRAGALLDWSAINVTVARDFLTHCVTNTGEGGNDFARVRDLYRYGTEALRHPDFSTEVLLALETMRAPGNLKGNAVRAGDPEHGYFTPPEIDMILEAIGKGTGTAEQRATSWLALELGRNALQYTLLTNADLRRVPAVTGDGRSTMLYQLRVRRMKKRTVSDETRTWPISTPLGDLLWSLRRGGNGDRLLWWLHVDRPETDLTVIMNAWARSAGLVSPRTAKPLQLNARRFRVTMLTNAADEGASPEHLAVLADHTDLQTIQVYIDRSPLFLLRIKDKVNAIYAPMVRRFKGQLTVSTATTMLDGSPGRVIPGFAPQIEGLDVGGIGFCGLKTLCNLAPPLTCYACDKFIAFRDGPHQQVVIALERQMKRLDQRIGLQVANALAAAREVVTMVEQEQPSETTPSPAVTP